MRTMWVELLQQRARMELQSVQTSHLIVEQNNLLQRLGNVETEKSVIQEQLVAMKSELDTVLARLTMPPRGLKIKVDNVVKVRILLYKELSTHHTCSPRFTGCSGGLLTLQRTDGCHACYRIRLNQARSQT
jgi:hypothetical protein